MKTTSIEGIIMTKNEILTYLFKHKNEFYKKFGITEIALFGSYARDEATNESDIDLLIEIEKNTIHIHDKKEAFKEMLQNAFGKKVDIARKKYLKPLAKKEILKDLYSV